MSRPLLNRRLVLETRARTPDGAGGYAEAWIVVGTLWGAVRPRSGRVTSVGDAPAVSVGRFEITVRTAPVGHSARPVAGQRLVMGTRAFRVQAVTEDEPDIRYLRCDCREETAT